MFLSYSKDHGQYVRDDVLNQQNIIDSTILMMNNPYTYLTEKNAILLNCKDPSKFQEVYYKTIEKHLKA